MGFWFGVFLRSFRLRLWLQMLLPVLCRRMSMIHLFFWHEISMSIFVFLDTYDPEPYIPTKNKMKIINNHMHKYILKNSRKQNDSKSSADQIVHQIKSQYNE